MNQKTLAKTISLVLYGAAMTATAAHATVLESKTMYNRYNEHTSAVVTDGPTYPSTGSQQNGSDGWVWGGVGAISSGNPHAADPGWVGTDGPTSSPFLTTKAIALNWAAHIVKAGDDLEVSQADAFSRYGIYPDIDTAGGAWHQSVGNGWRHNIDIGLFKSEVTQDVTLSIQGILNAQDNFGITVYKGLSTSDTFYNHHGPYNGDSSSNYEGMAYLTRTLRDPITQLTTNTLTFEAQAGQIYTIILGGNNGEDWDGKYDGYKLNISTVPLPGAVWFFGSALMGLVGFQRRKTANR